MIRGITPSVFLVESVENGHGLFIKGVIRKGTIGSVLFLKAMNTFAVRKPNGEYEIIEYPTPARVFSVKYNSKGKVYGVAPIEYYLRGFQDLVSSAVMFFPNHYTARKGLMEVLSEVEELLRELPPVTSVITGASEEALMEGVF